MKKFISILLAVALVASLAVAASAYSIYDEADPAPTADEALKAYADQNGGEMPPTYKYLFQMPNGQNGPVATKDVVYTETNEETGEERDILVCKQGEHAPTWYNEFTKGAGVYWWGSAPAACESWAGYAAMVEDADQSIYYANVPTKAVVFIWNNGVDGGMDRTQEIYYKAAQTIDVAAEYPDPGEWIGMPEGASSFNNGIFIINPDDVVVNPLSQKMTCGGSWYFYYEDGCYGLYAKDSANFVDVAHNCVNPQHYENEDITGEHKGYVAPAEPTEAPTEEPTEPKPVYVRGDYDNSGVVDILDATRAQRILAELSERPDEAFLAGVDADGDGELNITDATRIQNFVAELMNIDGSKPFVPAA